MAKDISIIVKRKKIAVVGAGIGGLVSALKLATMALKSKYLKAQIILAEKYEQ